MKMVIFGFKIGKILAPDMVGLELKQCFGVVRHLIMKFVYLAQSEGLIGQFDVQEKKELEILGIAHLGAKIYYLEANICNSLRKD